MIDAQLRENASEKMQKIRKAARKGERLVFPRNEAPAVDEYAACNTDTGQSASRGEDREFLVQDTRHRERRAAIGAGDEGIDRAAGEQSDGPRPGRGSNMAATYINLKAGTVGEVFKRMYAVGR